MSNTSYSFKENSHVIVNQGGEKKVMKKILSVALSTAMAFSMFASVAFGADAKLTPEQQFNALKEAGIVSGFPDGLSHLDRTLTRAELAKIIVNSLNLEPVTGVATYKDKGYSASHWAAPYIEAATAAGILNGKDATKKLFDPSGNVTVQELAKVLATALKLEVPADANNTASAWAKGYVAAAIEKGLIAEGINYQAAATRSQAVVAAYAIYETSQVPTVKSFKVVDPKNVEFTMSDGEVVKVALEKALEANKETEIKFTYKDKEYTHKVTYVTNEAQKLQSVKSDALKQIVVTFDGALDEETATNEDNYVIKDRTFRSATLSDDKTSVTLLIDENSAALVNQREVELEIKNVKSQNGTKTFSEKVKFTPLDVTAPTVKEVTSLGTKAFKIKFSEPIVGSTATLSSNYRIDGKAIGASVKFAFPDTVIVQTALTEGEHNVTVEGVKDFAGLGVAAVNNAFTVTADASAPEVVSAKSKDLKEVTVEFDETVKSVSEAYANSTSNKASIKIEDNKVILSFKNAINYTENTITLKGVSDYSDNKADREVKVTPTLDTVRPTVSEVELKINEEGHYVAKVRFSEKLHQDSLKRENFVLKNSEGKTGTVSGVNANGNPHLAPTFEDNIKANVILVDLGFGLASEKYTLTISNVKDNAAVPNLILPVTVDLDVTKIQNGEINRVWVERINSTESYVFVEFNKELSTDGDGSALSPAKYSLLRGGALIGQLTDKDLDVEMLTAKTVRIRTDKAFDFATYDYSVKASYIKDATGQYIKQGNSYELVKAVSETNAVNIKTDSVKAISRTEVKVEFDSAITSLVDSDFSVNGYPVVGTLAADGKSATLKVEDDHKFAATAAGVTLTTVRSLSSQNEYGIKLSALPEAGVVAKDEIKPEFVEDTMKIARIASATTATYNIELGLTETVQFNTAKFGPAAGAVANTAFEIEAKQGNDTYKGTVTSINYGTGKITLTVEFTKDDAPVANLGSNAAIVVKLKDENETAKYIIDTTGNSNALKAFTTSNVFNNIPSI